MEWILLGCVPIAIYWYIAYQMPPLDRRRMVKNFFTIVVVIAALGIAYEILTTGTFAAIPQDFFRRSAQTVLEAVRAFDAELDAIAKEAGR